MLEHPSSMLDLAIRELTDRPFRPQTIEERHDAFAGSFFEANHHGHYSTGRP